MKANDCPLVSVVLITYDRFDLLQHAVLELLRLCSYPNLEIIVTDDGSPAGVVERIRRLPISRVITSEENTGLGANSNRGLRAVGGKYVLHLQDDFALVTSEPFIERAIEIMERHPDVGLVRLHHVTPRFEVYEDHFLADGTRYSIIAFDQPPVRLGMYIYSDHPHLKRVDFHEKVGYFTEGLSTGETEDDFCRRFLQKKSYRVATFWRGDLFLNLGVNRSTRKDRCRKEIYRLVNRSLLGRRIVAVYRFLPRSLRCKVVRRIYKH